MPENKQPEKELAYAYTVLRFADGTTAFENHEKSPEKLSLKDIGHDLQAVARQVKITEDYNNAYNATLDALRDYDMAKENERRIKEAEKASVEMPNKKKN